MNSFLTRLYIKIVSILVSVLFICVLLWILTIQYFSKDNWNQQSCQSSILHDSIPSLQLNKHVVTVKFFQCKHWYRDGSDMSPTVQLFAEVYPNEIYIGDTIYISVKVFNRSDAPIVFGSYIPHYTLSLANYDWNVSAKRVKAYYSNALNFYKAFKHRELIYISTPQLMVGDGGGFEIDGHTLLTIDKLRLEIPYLLEWNSIYWQRMKQTLPPQGKIIPLLLFIQEEEALAVIPLKIKPRPVAEMELLNSWYNKLSKQEDFITFQPGDKEMYFPHDKNNKMVSIYGNRLFPARVPINRFISDIHGFFKPSGFNAPGSIHGWRNLEAKLVPSTMRDEIQMARMFMEYYDTIGEVQDKKLEEINTWLESLPKVQALILPHNIYIPENSSFYKANQKLKPIIDKFITVEDNPTKKVPPEILKQSEFEQNITIEEISR